MAFVEYANVASETDLIKFLPTQPNEPSQPQELFFFLRWAHEVSGILTQLPEQLSPEGQWFSALGELRWKKYRMGYQVLWLGQEPASTIDSLTKVKFTPIHRRWQTADHPALLHDRRTPQFPHLFTYPSQLTNRPNRPNRLWQRYFRDADTDVVHFVALTVHPPQAAEAAPETASETVTA
jgi:hypothetical protein